MRNFFAIRKCEKPAVFEITDEETLKEHCRKFGAVSHWSFKEDEREKALKWAGVKEVTPARSDAVYDEPQPQEEPPVPAEEPVAENLPEEEPDIPVAAGENSIVAALAALRDRGYAYVEIRLLSGDILYAILDDVIYWASNLIPTMFTPVYGGCDFKVRASFNDEFNWADMTDVRRVLVGNEGVNLPHVILSSERNLSKEGSSFQLLRRMDGARMVAMGDFVLFDRLYKKIERRVEKDEVHASLGAAETLVYALEDEVRDFVLNDKVIAMMAPVKIKERVLDPQFKAAFRKFRH